MPLLLSCVQLYLYLFPVEIDSLFFCLLEFQLFSFKTDVAFDCFICMCKRDCKQSSLFQICLSVPSTSQRCEILKLCLRDVAVADDVDVDKLSSLMSGCVGNDIRVMCSQASYLALKRQILATQQCNTPEVSIAVSVPTQHASRLIHFF
jgi:hypothetical protein